MSSDDKHDTHDKHEPQKQAATMANTTTCTTTELLKTVTNILTHIPKRELKNYFARHCAVNLKDVRRVQADWKCLSAAYDTFKTNLVQMIDDNDFYQNIFVQLACASAVMGRIDPTNDTKGLYAGCALFVSEWCKALGEIFFADCHPLSFYALWSPFLKRFGVAWEFHGTSEALLIALEECADEAGEAFAPHFPGPAPCKEATAEGTVDAIGLIDWTKAIRASDHRARLERIFGGTVSSRQVAYYNPADETFTYDLHRKYDNVWAVDYLQPPPEIVEFEQEDDDDETNATYKEEMDKLQSLLPLQKTE